MKNEYAVKMAAKRALELKRMREITIQWCMDAAIIAANETFHRRGEALVDFAEKMGEYAREIAQMQLDDAHDDRTLEYSRTKLDQRMKELLGEYFQPWDERYKVE